MARTNLFIRVYLNLKSHFSNSPNMRTKYSFLQSMETWQIPVIFTVGVIAGLINTLAGGGSLLSLPMLIFLGLPTTVANDTNRLAITVQSICAVTGFKRKGISNFKARLFMGGPALVGAIAGAQLSIDVSDILFKNMNKN